MSATHAYSPTPQNTQAIIDALHAMSPDGIQAPTPRSWQTSRPAGMPSHTTINTHHGSWSAMMKLAGLTMTNKGPKAGKVRTRPPSLSQIDAELFDAMGWTPTDPHTLTHMAHLPADGLIFVRKVIEPIWDWHRMGYVNCTRYILA